VTTLQAQQQSLPSAGVLLSPAPDGPVNRAGISGPVMLTAINGTPVSSSDEMIAYLELNTSPGDTVMLTVIGGDGRAQQVPVRLGARPEAAQ
jgi:S1-C subfamily serine protease